MGRAHRGKSQRAKKSITQKDSEPISKHFLLNETYSVIQVSQVFTCS